MRIRQHIGNVDIDISDARLQKNLRNAQRLLNMQIVADCDPLIPFQQGALRNSVNYPQGIYGGEIEYNTPYAQYNRLVLTAKQATDRATTYIPHSRNGRPLV